MLCMREVIVIFIDGDEFAFFEEALTLDYIDGRISSFARMECDYGMFEPALLQRKKSLLTCLNIFRAMII